MTLPARQLCESRLRHCLLVIAGTTEGLEFTGGGTAVLGDEAAGELGELGGTHSRSITVKGPRTVLQRPVSYAGVSVVPEVEASQRPVLFPTGPLVRAAREGAQRLRSCRGMASTCDGRHRGGSSLRLTWPAVPSRGLQTVAAPRAHEAEMEVEGIEGPRLEPHADQGRRERGRLVMIGCQKLSAWIDVAAQGWNAHPPISHGRS
jgi:hypothetical protein